VKERTEHPDGETLADPTAALRRWLVMSLVAFAGVMAAVFAALHFAAGDVDLGFFSLSAVLTCAVLVVMMRVHRDHRPAVLVATIYAAGVTIGLLAWSDAPFGDLVWCFVVPPMIAYAGGRQFARWALPVYLAAVALIVLLPGFARDVHWQELGLRPRFLGALLLLAAVSFLYELARTRAQGVLETEVRERRQAQGELAEANARLAEAADQAAELAAQAQAANLAKTRFLSHMSHDIRTPLTGIVGMTSVLELTALDEQQRMCVETIRVSGETLTDLIGDVLDIARIDAGRVRLQPAPADPVALVQSVCRVLEPQAEAKGLTLTVAMGAGLPDRVLVDAGRVERVLLNLAGNAVKFTDRGTVTVGAGLTPERAGLWWRLEVTDTGVGIAAGQHQRIFDSFTQVELGATRRQGGTGLGLAIVARLVALMGGELGLDSSVGRGSRFWVDLPLNEAGALAEDDGAAGSLDALPSLRLLLVDDNAIVRQVLGAMLRQAGHLVEDVDDGSLALERLAVRSYDAVLMDVQMPGLDGIEATRRLRAGAGGVIESRVPVVAVTALADEDTRRACQEAGVDALITKPVQGPQLAAVLARLCSIWPAGLVRRELQAQHLDVDLAVGPFGDGHGHLGGGAPGEGLEGRALAGGGLAHTEVHPQLHGADGPLALVADLGLEGARGLVHLDRLAADLGLVLQSLEGGLGLGDIDRQQGVGELVGHRLPGGGVAADVALFEGGGGRGAHDGGARQAGLDPHAVGGLHRLPGQGRGLHLAQAAVGEHGRRAALQLYRPATRSRALGGQQGAAGLGSQGGQPVGAHQLEARGRGRGRQGIVVLALEQGLQQLEAGGIGGQAG